MSQYVEIEAEVLRTSDRAALLEIDGDEHWVPFSQIEDNGEDVAKGFSGSLYRTRWICDEKCIDYSDE